MENKVTCSHCDALMVRKSTGWHEVYEEMVHEYECTRCDNTEYELAGS